uniref:Uncharacterized protein n=1 Tax=Eutreptiella gymnastica TaxID=73025 RepID=A0A7S1N3C3_9EUGL
MSSAQRAPSDGAREAPAAGPRRALHRRRPLSVPGARVPLIPPSRPTPKMAHRAISAGSTFPSLHGGPLGPKGARGSEYPPPPSPSPARPGLAAGVTGVQAAGRWAVAALLPL